MFIFLQKGKEVTISLPFSLPQAHLRGLKVDDILIKLHEIGISLFIGGSPEHQGLENHDKRILRQELDRLKILIKLRVLQVDGIFIVSIGGGRTVKL